MRNWIPLDEELIEVLCRVRETDWKRADHQANRRGGPFGEYGEYLWKRQNYPDIPPGYMLSPKAWRWMTLPEVLDDIFSRKGSDADGHRQSLFRAIDDYRFAAINKLLDVLRWERDRHEHESPEYIAIDNRRQVIRNAKELSGEHIPDNPIRGWLIQFLGTEKRDEYDVVYEEHLIKKIIVCQGLKVLISERIQPLAPNAKERELATYRCEPEIYYLLDEFWREADEKMREEMIRCMPGNSKRGNKPKVAKTKTQFMKELEDRCKGKSKGVPTGDTFRSHYDKWAKDRHSQLITTEFG